MSRLVRLFAFLFAAAALSPLAAAPPPLHTVEDYLQHSPDRILDAQQRQRLRDAGRESRSELPPSDLLRYGASYRFESPDVKVAALLLIGRDAAAATALLANLRAADDSDEERRLGIRRRVLAGMPEDGNRYEQLLGSDGATIEGNRFILRHGNAVYLVILSGLGGFDSAAAATAFLDLRRGQVFGYDPAARSGPVVGDR